MWIYRELLARYKIGITQQPTHPRIYPSIYSIDLSIVLLTLPADQASRSFLLFLAILSYLP